MKFKLILGIDYIFEFIYFLLILFLYEIFNTSNNTILIN